MNSCLQYVFLMIPFIYCTLKYIFGMFYNKICFIFYGVKRSSLFYKTSARNERHKCDTSATRSTQMWHGWETSDTCTTGVQHEHERHRCYISAKRVQHKCDTKKAWFCEWKAGHSWFFNLKVVWLNGIDYRSTSL